MAACSVMFARLVVCRELPGCVRVLSHGFPAPVTDRRSLHSSPGLAAKSCLYKFTSKKKKPWYNSTMHLSPEKKPPGLLSLLKHQKVAKRENNPRIRAFDGILYNALTGLLNTSEVSEEIYNFCIELSKVSVCADFSVCRAYWLSSGNKETDDEIEKLLQKYAPRFRHVMISHHVLGNVPSVVFVRDRDDAKIRQVEDILTTLQFEKRDVLPAQTSESKKLDIQSVKDSSGVQVHSVFGIDHAELNQQIFAYKKKVKAIPETDSSEHSEQQQKQLAAIRKQNLQRKKMKKLKGLSYDIRPQDYQLLSAMDSNTEEELDFEVYEDLVESDEEEEPNTENTRK